MILPALLLAAAASAPVHVKILGINDFHGAIETRRVGGRPAGGAAVLAAWLEAARRGHPGPTLIVHAGDQVGASPPASALLQDEPAVTMLNLLAGEHCRHGEDDERCDVIGTPGNHEFDEGPLELLRLIGGGNHAAGPFLEDPWHGARYAHVAASVEWRKGGRLFAGHAVRRLGPVRVGVIGAVLEETPTIVTPAGVGALRFLDEATAINREVRALKRKGVRTIVVTIHQGGWQDEYEGPTDPGRGPIEGPIVAIAAELDGEVDLLVTGHTHRFTNGRLKVRGGREVLAVQAHSRGTAFSDVDLHVDPATGDVVSSSARIVTAWADVGPGRTPHPELARIVARAHEAVAPRVDRIVTTAAAALGRTTSASGESPLANLIADAQRAAMGSDVALMNPGGVRDDLPAGPVTWGQLFSIQPFGNAVVVVELTGRKLREVLEQQWLGPRHRVLGVSGLRYTWDPAAPSGRRVVDVEVAGKRLEPRRRYTVTVNGFLATGGDRFSALQGAKERARRPDDLEVLVDYLAKAPQPFTADTGGRIATAPRPSP